MPVGSKVLRHPLLDCAGRGENAPERADRLWHVLWREPCADDGLYGIGYHAGELQSRGRQLPARRLPAGHDALHRRARAAGGGVPVPRRAVCAAGAQMSPGCLCAVHVPVCGDACVPIPWLHDCGQYDPVPEPLSPGELLAVLGLSEDGQHLGLYFPAYVHQFPIRAREPSALADASVPVL